MDVPQDVQQPQMHVNEEFRNKMVINETVLLRKILLIKKYYAQAKKAFVFFNSQSFDRKPIEKEIFELFFSAKLYQGRQSMEFNGLEYIIYESNFKFVSKKSKLPNENILNSGSNIFEMSKGSQVQDENRPQIHEYHYFGQVLHSTQSLAENTLQSSTTNLQSPDMTHHGYGLLLNFDTKQLVASQGHSINCYFGQFINGLKHGQGMEFKQHPSSKELIQVYLGNFVNGNYDDDSAIWLKIKLIPKPSQQEHNQNQNIEFVDKYYGGFVNGKKHGKGIISSSELFYDGDWRFDKPEGMGEIWTSTSYYKGRFKSGLKHRNGKQLFKNGDIYEGAYSNNKPSGQGKYLWKNGSFYEGEFKNGLRDGKGLWKSGSQSYEGNYLNDKKSGEGIYYWNDGETYYKGTFYEDVRHGCGQMYWDNSKSAYKGKWKEGFQDGYGEVFELDTLSKQIKLVKKGLFFKGNMIEQIVEKDQTSIEPSPQKKSLSSDSDGFHPNQLSEQNSEETYKIPKIPIKKPTKLRKPTAVKGIKHENETPYQFDRQNQSNQNIEIQKSFNPNERKKFSKSQNQNYPEFLNKQDALKHIHEKHIYLMDVQKDPIQKEHLYGSVYLIKSGRKRLNSSVQNIPKAHVSRGSDHKLSDPSSENGVKTHKNNRRSSQSNTQPVNKLIQEKEENLKLQQIHNKRSHSKPFPSHRNIKHKKQLNQIAPKQLLNLPKRNTSNQAKQIKLRYFDPEDEKNFAELEPLIFWNNFSRKSRTPFLK